MTGFGHKNLLISAVQCAPSAEHADLFVCGLFVLDARGPGKARLDVPSRRARRPRQGVGHLARSLAVSEPTFCEETSLRVPSPAASYSYVGKASTVGCKTNRHVTDKMTPRTSFESPAMNRAHL